MTTEAKKIKEEIERKMKFELEDIKKENDSNLNKLLGRLDRLFNYGVEIGREAGENSKHKSDLQQELEKWEELDKDNAISLNKDYMFKVKDRINFIKKELEEIGKW